MRVLVTDGGGMRGTFTAGVFAGLKENGVDHSFFQLYVGSSGGACCTAYFLTDQVEQGLRCWREHLPRNFMRWKGIKPCNDAAYLEKLFREIEPLSCSTLAGREKSVVALADPVNQRTEYKCLNTFPDPIRLLVASTTMPFFSGPAVLDGNLYYDANLICAIPFQYTELIGASEIWVILTTPYGYRRQGWRWNIASWFTGDKRASRLLVQRSRVENAVLEQMEVRNDLFVIRPERGLPIHWRDSDKKSIAATIELGKQAAKKVLARR